MDRHSLENTVGPVVAGLVLLVTLIGLLGTATRDPRPHDIPVGLSAPPALVTSLTSAFASAAPGAFKFTTFDSEAAARAAIDTRDVVASLVVGPSGPRLIVAGASGDAISGGVTAAFTNAFRAQNTTLPIEVVHPFQVGDPHGIGLFFLVLAILLSSLMTAALLAMRAGDRGVPTQLGVLVAYAGLAGICGTLAAAWIVDGYGDKLWQVVALVALLSLAVAAVTVACARVLGPAGVALSALIVVLLGLVASGGPLGSELLPDAYRLIAPFMLPGQAYSALRGALYFDGAGVLGPVTVLAMWATAGLAVMLFAPPARAARRPRVAVPA